MAEFKQVFCAHQQDQPSLGLIALAKEVKVSPQQQSPILQGSMIVGP
jgi:hypothetical protein